MNNEAVTHRQIDACGCTLDAMHGNDMMHNWVCAALAIATLCAFVGPHLLLCCFCFASWKVRQVLSLHNEQRAAMPSHGCLGALLTVLQVACSNALMCPICSNALMYSDGCNSLQSMSCVL